MNLRPMRALKPGRYVLDARGRLHPLRRRYHVAVVAIVNVKAKPQAKAKIAPPVPHVPVPPPPPDRAKIDLTKARSSMEDRAASWKGKS